MKKVFTIKEGIPLGTYGFERSQLARQQLLKEMNISHELVITNLGNYTPNLVENMTKIGFNNFYHAVYDQSDLTRSKPSIDKSFVQTLDNVSEVEYTNDGFVGLVHYNDDTIEGYTSQLLYRLNPNTFTFTLYDSKGILIEGDLRKSYHSYRFVRTGEVYDQWQLVSLYLSENSSQEDCFIIDMLNEYPLQLRKFFQNTGRTLYAYTHYNIIDPMMKFVLHPWCSNVVASPLIEDFLGSDKVKFLPPIYVESLKQKDYSQVTNWCIVGNMSFIKRCEWAIEAFRQLKGSQLTIYGSLPKGYSKDNLPPNVHYAGFMKSVPYEKHQGYLSCSMSECFANSAVEASAHGLVCLLSDVDLAHRYYGNSCKNTEVFQTFDELVFYLSKFEKVGEYHSSTFASFYTIEKVKTTYEKILKLNNGNE